MATPVVLSYQTKSKRDLFADVPVSPILTTSSSEPADLQLEYDVPITCVPSAEGIGFRPASPQNNNNSTSTSTSDNNENTENTEMESISTTNIVIPAAAIVSKGSPSKSNKGGTISSSNKPIRTTQGGNFFTRLYGIIAGNKSRNKKGRKAAPSTKGVYFDFRTDDVPSDSVKTIDTAISNDDDGGEAVYVPNWIPSNRENHQQDVPVVVRRPEYDTYNEADDKKLLKKIMSRAKKLPQDHGKYASNHIMINAERTRRNIPPMRRERHLDQIAREQAKLMSEERKLFHIDTPIDLQNRLNEKDNDHHELPTFERMGMNIGRGKTITEVHKFMMAALAERNNIQDKRFFTMGMGTHRADNGVIYMCQIFGG